MADLAQLLRNLKRKLIKKNTAPHLDYDWFIEHLLVVSSHVFSPRGHVTEGLVADLTDIRPLPGVGPLVLLQVGRNRERLAATLVVTPGREGGLEI